MEAVYQKKSPAWLATDAPETGVVLFSQCSLMRNLSDFSFPGCCTVEEQALIEERILRALDLLDAQWHGQYFSNAGLGNGQESSVERRLMPLGSAARHAHGGLYVLDDQSTSISVNGTDHLCLTAVGAGLQVGEMWARINALDDALSEVVDYAFDKELGYMTASMSHVGTGLKVSAVLHLPGLSRTDMIGFVAQTAREHHHALMGLEAAPRSGDAEAKAQSLVGDFLYYGLAETALVEGQEPASDLYVLSNRITLGRSEEEIVFHLRHAAHEIISREKEARKELLDADERVARDRVARALGLARSVQLLELPEALSLLSSIRFGVEVGWVDAFSVQQIDEMYVTSQDAPLTKRLDRGCDERALSMARADLFRARFSQDRKV